MSKFYPGVISRARLNGTYDIDYDDGEKETSVAAELIRSLSKAGIKEDGDAPHKTAGSRQESPPIFRVGTPVEALYKGKDKYYKGKIARIHADGTYDIDYDDGDKETKIPGRNIRPLKPSASSNFSTTTERPTRPSIRRSGNSSD
jgi:hypothetical protein